MSILQLNDSMKFSDDTNRFKKRENNTYRTKVIGGYDAFKDKNGVTRFGEKLFEEENMIVLGGSLFTLEKVFGVPSNLTVAYLEDIMPDIRIPGETPNTERYPKDTVVCLYGVGIGGSGESITDVYPVRYYEREISDMIPLRQTAVALAGTDVGKYWFRKSVTVGGTNKTAYYLKTFEGTPEIKTLWRDAEGDDDFSNEDGSEVQDNVHETSSTNTTAIETFVEVVLEISKNDVREYFTDNGVIEQSRINSIGLFTGIRTKIQDSPELFDYRQVKLFSKLNINNEMLTLEKDLTIVYRIYTS